MARQFAFRPGGLRGIAAGCGALLLVLVALSPRSVAADERPNLIVILSDDMGYSDIGCYGGEIETPHLDALAAGGLRLTQFYNTGRCCPTRASLLTGLYPQAAGVGHMMDDRGLESYSGDLSPRSLTIAEVLKTAGYRTGLFGKWHVTRHVAPDGPKHNWPLQRGFDDSYGIISGAASFWDPWSLTRGNTRISAFADDAYVAERDSPAGGPYYFTDAISDHAVRAVREHSQQGREEPLFLYVSYTAAHWPMHARERDIAKYRGRYDSGYGPIREARLAKMKRLGLLDEATPLSPQAWDWGQADTTWEAENMAIYAAMVDSMDQGIGRIVGALREAGELENTVIFYCQDNGGCAETIGRNPKATTQTKSNRYGTTRGIIKGERPTAPLFEPLPDDAFIGAMVPPQTRDGYPIRGGLEATGGGPDTYVAYGEGWANVSNTPFRHYKHYVHEGGIGTPLIVHWPRGLPRAGELDATPSHLVDIMATCVDLAGARYPTERQGVATRPLAGQSLRPLLVGDGLPPRQLFWEHEGNRAVREGNWKLVALENKPWELYDLSRDRNELEDLAATHPELVTRLSAAWDTWAERDGVDATAWRRKRVSAE